MTNKKAVAWRWIEGWTEKSWGYNNTEDFIGVLYLICEAPAKHTPGKAGHGKSGSPMPNIFIVPTMYHTYLITCTYQCERNSSISVSSLKPWFECFYTSFSRQQKRFQLEVPASSLFILKDFPVGTNLLLLQSSQYFWLPDPGNNHSSG